MQILTHFLETDFLIPTSFKKNGLTNNAHLLYVLH